MDLCNGGSVESRISRHGSFSPGTAQALFLQLLRGMNYLHLKRVVHRDIKPANMMLHRDISILRITDFNSAKRIGNSAGSSVMLTDRGTHVYSAPELRFGRLWNERIDIWAAGLSLYYMVRAKLPFDNQDRAVAKLLSMGQLPNINWDGFPALLRALLQQCLLVDMQDRPPALELLEHPAFYSSKDPLNRGRSASISFKGSTADLLDLCGEERSSRYQAGDIFGTLPSVGLVAVQLQRRFDLLAKQAYKSRPARKRSVMRRPSRKSCGMPRAATSLAIRVWELLQRLLPKANCFTFLNWFRQSCASVPPSPVLHRKAGRPRAMSSNSESSLDSSSGMGSPAFGDLGLPLRLSRARNAHSAPDLSEMTTSLTSPAWTTPSPTLPTLEPLPESHSSLESLDECRMSFREEDDGMRKRISAPEFPDEQRGTAKSACIFRLLARRKCERTIRRGHTPQGLRTLSADDECQS